MKWKWFLSSKVGHILTAENEKLRQQITKLTAQRDKARMQRDNARGSSAESSPTSGSAPFGQAPHAPQTARGAPMTRIEKLERTLSNLTTSLDLLKSKIELPSGQWYHLQELRRQSPPV